MSEKWQQREVNFLKSLAGEYPFNLIVRKFDRKHREGWPKRTKDSLRSKIHDLGMSTAVVNSHLITSGDIRSTLKCSTWLIDQLIRNKNISDIAKPSKFGKSWYFERKNLIKLAKKMPRFFCKFDQNDLFILLEDAETVDIVMRSKSKNTSYYAIRCIETGQEWANAVAAGKELNVSRKTIQTAIKERRPVTCINLTFEYLSPLAPRIKTQSDSRINDEPIN